MYDVRVLEGAADDLARLDKTSGRRVIERIRWLATNIDAIRNEALKGSLSGLYKMRAGDYRIIYEVLHGEQVLLIHAVGHRREIYRKR